MSETTPEIQAEPDARPTSFGRVADEYEVFRPGPALEAITWLFPEPTGTVVDLGSGTGALARLLMPVAQEVIAVEPDPTMRRALVSLVPGVDVHDGRGESLPVGDGSIDAVVASSSWHWVDPVGGAAEAARVVKPGGFLAALWTGPDPEGAFLAQAQAALRSNGGNTVLGATLAGDLAPTGTTLSLPGHVGFGPVEHRRFEWTVALTADQLIGLLGTFSWIILMEEDERRQVYETANRLLREVLGIDGEVTVDVEFACEAYRAPRYRVIRPDPVDALVLDLLEWVGPQGRSYREVMEAWTTSCPRLPVWEEAVDRRLVVRAAGASGGATVEVTDLGCECLATSGRPRGGP